MRVEDCLPKWKALVVPVHVVARHVAGESHGLGLAPFEFLASQGPHVPMVQQVVKGVQPRKSSRICVVRKF